MISLGCDDVLKDNDKFGGTFQDNRANHQLYIVQCPTGCSSNGESIAMGLGIHP